jgi:hypothetical protein
VGDVSFDPKTGEVRFLAVTQGATANALLGVREIPGSMIRGFRRGIGTALSVNGQADAENPELGAILVSDEVAELAVEGAWPPRPARPRPWWPIGPGKRWRR